MTAPKTGSPTRAEFAALAKELAEVRSAANAAKVASESATKTAGETHDMVQSIHNKLMQPQPGQKLSLLDRMASVTIDIESGKRTGQIIMALVGFAIAVAALLKWGHLPSGKV
ncbi:MAG: hypothetical protein ACK4MS_10450 [Paracoccaceae bacterium]